MEERGREKQGMEEIEKGEEEGCLRYVHNWKKGWK